MIDIRLSTQYGIRQTVMTVSLCYSSAVLAYAVCISEERCLQI